MKLLANSFQIITVNTDGKNCKRGNELANIGMLTEHAIVIENDVIKDLIPNSSIKNPSRYDIIDVQDKVILPGLVECHTHAAFAGSRVLPLGKPIHRAVVVRAEVCIHGRFPLPSIVRRPPRCDAPSLPRLHASAATTGDDSSAECICWHRAMANLAG